MERATKATPKLFKQLAGVDINTFELVIIGYYYDSNLRSGKGIMQKPPGYDDLASGDNEFINSVLDLIVDYDMLYGDISRISSWGVVN